LLAIAAAIPLSAGVSPVPDALASPDGIGTGFVGATRGTFVSLDTGLVPIDSTIVRTFRVS
jgi:hypothetical protein